MSPSFEWNETKARSNLDKHGVSFEEAVGVFANPLAAIFVDPEHSQNELREIIIGHSERNRVLVVSFFEAGEVVRIISARVATSTERRNYEENPLKGWKDE